jgi:hypothetical protein
MHHHQRFAWAVEPAAEIVVGRMLAKERHHRTVRAPAEGLGQVQPVAVAGLQLDDAQTIQRHERPHHLGGAEGIGLDDLLERPLTQAANRQQQQVPVGHDRLFLLRRQLPPLRLRIGHAASDIGEIQPQHAQHVVDARKRHVAAGKHALHAGFGEADSGCQLGVRHAGRFEFGLQGGDEFGCAAHDEVSFGNTKKAMASLFVFLS